MAKQVLVSVIVIVLLLCLAVGVLLADSLHKEPISSPSMSSQEAQRKGVLVKRVPITRISDEGKLGTVFDECWVETIYEYSPKLFTPKRKAGVRICLAYNKQGVLGPFTNPYLIEEYDSQGQPYTHFRSSGGSYTRTKIVTAYNFDTNELPDDMTICIVLKNEDYAKRRHGDPAPKRQDLAPLSEYSLQISDKK